MGQTPTSHDGGRGLPGLFRVLWARPSILLIGLAIGLIAGLNLAPDAGPSPAAPRTVSASASPPAPTLPVAAAKAASIAALHPVVSPTPASADVKVQLAKLASQGRPLTVGVFGDSLGDGVWAALYRQLHSAQLHSAKAFDVVRLSQVSTGLSRYNYVDVQAKTVEQLASQHVDIAVFMFGANDQQGIVDGGKIYPFGSDGWRAAYGRRVDALVMTLRQQGAVIYWVGLPKMEKARFDQGAALINAVLEQHMTALGARFVPTVPLTVDQQGDYAAYLADPGGKVKRLMRANDGVHMSMAGYLRISAPVATLIRGDLAAAAPAAPPLTTPALATGGEPVTQPASVALEARTADDHP